MAKTKGKTGRLRHLVQLGFTALTNSYLAGYMGGTIYTGALKSACVPGLNCYSCPGALGSCPIGALQALVGGHKIPFYLLGFLMMVGALLGRAVCGWLCPFGLVQDLIHKIPFPRRWKGLPGDRWLRYLKYAILMGFVILLPLFGAGDFGQSKPWFCMLICPSGTLLAGLPLVMMNESLQALVGWLYAWKVGLLLLLLLLSVIVWRPFCRYLCPLGAIYGLFNPIAAVRFTVEREKCTHCGACSRACKMGLPVDRHPNSPECVRCGDCLRACPTGAVHLKTPATAGCPRCQSPAVTSTPGKRGRQVR